MRVLALLYHEVTDNPNETGFQRKKAYPYKHSIKEFEQHLSLIIEKKNQIKTIDKIDNKLDNILLTFDDGGASNLWIAKRLNTLGIKGHFFISTKFIGKKHFLSESDIKYIYGNGHIIGSHSHTHPNVFCSQTKEEMINEWTLSKKILEKIIDSPVETCSIPGGDASLLTYETACQSGFKFIFNSEPSVIPYEFQNSIIVGRLSLKKGEPLSRLINLLNHKGIIKEKLIRRIKVLVKKLLFPLYSKIHNSRDHEE